MICGVAGGDEGIRGFVAAYKATTGQLAWRFWTVPKRGEPGSETWSGKAIEVGGGSTWLTGSYDPETQLLYWPTGNPFPDTDGEDRKGDNLYTNCVVALDINTGKLRWYFQFTPHDLHDWDATEPLVLVNARFGGKDRKLLLQANRNGFYYVLDRTNGEFLLGQPFVKKLTWASGIDKKGRPQLVEGNKPSRAGTVTCPAVRGATNWYSTAFNPDDEAVLCNGGRGLQHLPAVATRRICPAPRSESAAGEISARARFRNRQNRLGDSAGGPAGVQLLGCPIDGWRVWCSMARPAAVSPLSMRRPGRRFGISRRTRRGKRPR